MNKFDQVVLGALDIGQSEALKRKNTELTPEHVLWGLILNKSSYASKAMKDNTAEVEALLNKLPKTTNNVTIESLRTSSKLQEWITLASGDSAQQGKGEVSEKHLLKHLPQIFPALKVDYQKFSEAAEDVEIPAFLINLNELAAQGKLDPVIVHAYSKAGKFYQSSERIVRVLPETKFSLEWDMCHDNQLEHYQIMKKSLPKNELKSVSNYLSGQAVQTETEKEFDGIKRVKITRIYPA